MTQSVRRVHVRLHTIQGPRNVRILHQHSRECPPSEEVDSRAQKLKRAYIMDPQAPYTARSEGREEVMVIGVRKEMKDHEYRVCVMPDGARAWRQAGHDACTEPPAGVGSGS